MSGTAPLIDEEAKEKRKTCVHRAALYLFESLDGETRIHPLEDKHSRREAFKKRLDYQGTVKLLSFFGAMLTFLERPRWCKESVYVGHACTSDVYPSYPIPFLNYYENMVPELLFFGVFLLDAILLIHAQGFTRACTDQRQKFRLVCLAVNFADIAWAYALNGYWGIRISPYCRIFLFASYSHHVEARFKLIFGMLREVFDVIMLVVAFLFIFAWVGVLLFPGDSDEGQAWFNGLGNGMWSLLVLITTANFPDIMMPAYKENRLAFLFFFAFVCFGCFLMINVITAVVFNSFTDQKEARAKEKEVVRNKARKLCFDALASIDGGKDEIGLQETQWLFKELHHYQDIEHMPKGAEGLFSSLDKDNSGTIDFEEFETIQKALEECMHTKTTPRPPWLERVFPELKTHTAWNSVRDMVGSTHWAIMIDVVLLFAVGLAFSESYMNGLLSPHSSQRIKVEEAGVGNIWSPTSFAFWNIVLTVLFVIEAFTKLTVMGGDRYWSKLMNCYDFWITMLTASIVIYTILFAASEQLLRLAAMLRVGRVLRLMIHASKTFRVTAETFVAILPDGVAIVKVLFVAMYFFSFLGMQLFGGKINTDPKSPYSKPVAATDYAGADYYANNFNDMPSGMVTLFECIVVNNWFEIVDGFSAAVANSPFLGISGTVWAPAFFIAWYIFGVLITMNIVISFVLNEFVDKFHDGMLSTGNSKRAYAADDQEEGEMLD